LSDEPYLLSVFMNGYFGVERYSPSDQIIPDNLAHTQFVREIRSETH
jgi:hypothetical protein